MFKSESLISEFCTLLLGLSTIGRLSTVCNLGLVDLNPLPRSFVMLRSATVTPLAMDTFEDKMFVDLEDWTLPSTDMIGGGLVVS